MASFVCITIDAHDPVRLAAFWAETLGWSLEANSWDGTKNHVRRPDDAFYLEFFPTHGAKVEKIRMHFGLSCDDIEAEMDRLEALGATHAWEEIFWGKSNGYRNVVMRDPEGNEFCLGWSAATPSDGTPGDAEGSDVYSDVWSARRSTSRPHSAEP